MESRASFISNTTSTIWLNTSRNYNHVMKKKVLKTLSQIALHNSIVVTDHNVIPSDMTTRRSSFEYQRKRSDEYWSVLQTEWFKFKNKTSDKDLHGRTWIDDHYRVYWVLFQTFSLKWSIRSLFFWVLFSTSSTTITSTKFFFYSWMFSFFFS